MGYSVSQLIVVFAGMKVRDCGHTSRLIFSRIAARHVLCFSEKSQHFSNTQPMLGCNVLCIRKRFAISTRKRYVAVAAARNAK